jgi:hypothetical protein
MGHSKVSQLSMPLQGLGVGDITRTGGGIPDMSDTQMTVHLFKNDGTENLGDKPHTLFGHQTAVFSHGDTGTLLTPVLQGQ